MVWHHEWVVHVQHACTGERVLDYLAPYVFRIALVNSRLEHFEDGHVTFRYRDGRTGTTKRCTLDAVSFIGRFLQHVLPQGFSKVRHYGLFSPSRHDLLAQAREQLIAASASPPPTRGPIDPAPVLAPELLATALPGLRDRRAAPRRDPSALWPLTIINLLPSRQILPRPRPRPAGTPGGVRLAGENPSFIPLRRDPPGRAPPSPSPALVPFRRSTPLPPDPRTPLDLQARAAEGGSSSTPPFAAAARGKKP